MKKYVVTWEHTEAIPVMADSIVEAIEIAEMYGYEGEIISVIKSE